MTLDAPAAAHHAGRHGGGLRAALARVRWRRVVAEALAVVAVFAAVGAGAGWLWQRLWDPPMGAVQEGEWRFLDFAAIGEVFSGTGLYVVIGVLGGLLLGVVAALVCRASEVATLLAVAAGSALAAWVAYLVGTAPNPVNPHLLALVMPEGTVLPGRLTITGHSPYVAWPLGALVGLAGTYVLTTGVSAGVAEARRVDLPPDPGQPAQQG